MVRFPALPAAAIAALAAAVLLSSNAGAANPATGSSTRTTDTCAGVDMGIPWIVSPPDSCDDAAAEGAVPSNQTGMHNLAAGGAPVFIDASGQMGTVSSSARYKKDITNMHFDPGKLLELRPVTFHYKKDPDGPVQYGLIGEEVEKLFPDLVIHDDDGKVQSVRYDELSSILLKQVQEQQTAMGEQQRQLDAQTVKMEMQYHQLQAQDEQIRYLGDRVAQMQKLVEKVMKASQ